jgi:sporulation protein YlmC with PRC-barrel domain
MNKRLFLLAAPVLCLFVSANAFGQDAKVEGKRSIHPAGRILGMDIRSAKNTNESLGSVEDIVVNMKDGKCVYMAMSRGKVLGFGGNFFAISPDALKMGENSEYLILNATNQEFENAKGFDQNSWPMQPERRWGAASTTNRTEEQPRTEDQPKQGSIKNNENLARITAIRGLTVYGRNTAANNNNTDSKDASVGSIYDIALDCSKHQIAYVAIHHGGTLGVGGKLVAVPWQALTLRAPALDPQRRAFYINATAQDFERAQGFTSDAWPTEPTQAFRDLRPQSGVNNER